jgi:hypothetical protein
MLRVLASAPLADIERVLSLPAALPPHASHAGCELHPPMDHGDVGRLEFSISGA